MNKTWKYYGKKCFKPFLCAIISFVVMSIHDHKGGDMYLKFIFNLVITKINLLNYFYVKLITYHYLKYPIGQN